MAMPAAASGKTMNVVTRQRLRPSASPASRRSPGIRRTTSSVVRARIGIMMIPSAKPPASAEKCPIGKTITVYAKMPMTMDGTPMRASTRKRMSSLKRPVPAYSARYTPDPTPSGMPMAAASATRVSVPSSELSMPPPGSPTGAGSLVKKSTLICEPPLYEEEPEEEQQDADGHHAHQQGHDLDDPAERSDVAQDPTATRRTKWPAAQACLDAHRLSTDRTPIRRIIQWARTFMAEVRMNSTKPASISAERYRGELTSVNSLAMTLAMV